MGFQKSTFAGDRWDMGTEDLHITSILDFSERWELEGEQRLKF